MKVNGESVVLEQDISLESYLSTEGYNLSRIAVERNGDIVPKGTYGQVMLTESDTLEIVTFVGGG